MTYLTCNTCNRLETCQILTEAIKVDQSITKHTFGCILYKNDFYKGYSTKLSLRSKPNDHRMF